MAFQPVLLWSDILLFLLIAVVVAGVFYVRSQPHMLEPWRRVGSSGSAMASLTLLLLFVLTGVLDSLHYRPRLESASAATTDVRHSVEVRSAFDALAHVLRRGAEKTYSAPFAAYLYDKENIDRPDGTQFRDFPRLKHAAAHLQDPSSQLVPDVLSGLARALPVAAALWLAIALGVAWRVARQSACSLASAWRAIWRRETPIAWNGVLTALGATLVLLVPLFLLSADYHVFGTDKVGQDVLYLTLKSIRTALVIGTLTTLVMMPFAIALGVVAGYFGGRIDDVVQYIYTTLNSIPGVLLIAASVLMMQVVIDTHPDWFATSAERADARLLALCGILGVTSWTGLCRLLRGETLKLRELDYVQAARAFGVTQVRIMIRHILPNLMHLVLITVVMDFSGLVLAEAVLSYVGIGVDPNTVSFGTMINQARMELSRDPMVWWSLAAAFVFMFVLVLSANLFADVVREALDPRMQILSRNRLNRKAAHA